MTQHGRKANGSNMPRETGIVSGCYRIQTWLPTNKSTQGKKRPPRIPRTKEPERVTVARIKPRPPRPANRDPQHKAGTARVDGGNRSGPQDRTRGQDRGRHKPPVQMYLQRAAQGPNHLHPRLHPRGPKHHPGGMEAAQRELTPPAAPPAQIWQEEDPSFLHEIQRRSSKMRS